MSVPPETLFRFRFDFHQNVSISISVLQNSISIFIFSFFFSFFRGKIGNFPLHFHPYLIVLPRPILSSRYHGVLSVFVFVSIWVAACMALCFSLSATVGALDVWSLLLATIKKDQRTFSERNNPFITKLKAGTFD
jgi:hypothetical protein